MPTARELIATVLDTPPDDLVAHFEASNHPYDPELGIQLLSIDEAVEMSRKLHDYTLPGRPMGLFALLYANDSTPFCYISRGPARGSVLHLYHDDDPVIEFASLAEFREALASAVRDGVDIDDLPPGSPPNLDQQELGERLARLEEDGSDAAEFEYSILLPLAGPAV